MAVRTYARRATSFTSEPEIRDRGSGSQGSQGSCSGSESVLDRRVPAAASAFDFSDEEVGSKRARPLISSRSSPFSSESGGTPKLRRSSSSNKSPLSEKGAASFTEMKEHGAQRSLLDQVEYALDGLDAKQGLQTRRNSALEIATLSATNPEISFLFRAHGMFDRTMELLRSCNDDKVLWSAAAAITYFLFKDNLNTEYVSATSLSLLVSLLNQRSGKDSLPAPRKFGRSPEDYMVSLRALFENEENRFGRDTDTIEPSVLALHTLAHLSSHQQSLRNTLRTCGLLDIICRQLTQLANETASLAALSADALEDANLLMSILENVTFLNRTTQEYLASLPQLLPNVVAFVDRALSALKPTEVGGMLYSSLLYATRVLLNLTHKNAAAGKSLGEAGVATILRLVRFTEGTSDMQARMLSIGLLVNLLEVSQEIRVLLREKGEVDFIVELYRRAHAEMVAKPESEEETVVSYLALLIGCLIKEEEQNRTAVLKLLPTHNFDDLITRIGYFIAQQLDNGVLSREAHQSYVAILEVLDPQAAAEARRELSQEVASEQ